MQLFDVGAEYKQTAEAISRQLKLDYGAVDFLIADKPVFLECNSNAYFTGIERLGADIAGPIAAYVLQQLSGGDKNA
jgi:glutathione synthase/RimK-type ligase-like ATP-grasp enzyme